MMRRVFIGYDSRVPRAFDVAARSLAESSGYRFPAHRLDAVELRAKRLLWRPTTHDLAGNLWDVLSDAPQSTEFAITRFLVPFMVRDGWSLFVDQDVVFLDDVSHLFALADSRFAVMVVKHEMGETGGWKMVGQVQTSYPRKNWSSVVLWNHEHPAHHRLSLGMVNQYPGDLLHRFCWLRDSEIGALPPEWNWLVNVQPKPARPCIAHFTLGGPWIEGWEPAPFDEIWHAAAAEGTP